MKQIEGLVSSFVQRRTEEVSGAACISGAEQRQMSEDMSTTKQQLRSTLAGIQLAHQVHAHLLCS